jgi:hypothetical protein
LQPPRSLLILAAAVPWLAGASAYAQPTAIGSAEVLTGAGHDSNMFLQITPDLVNAEPLISGWFGRVAPALSGALAWPEWRLGLSYRLDYRGSQAAGSMLQHEGELSLAVPALGRLRPWLGVSVGRFDAYRFPEEGFWLAGGNLGLRFELTSALRLFLAYRLDRRGATDGAGSSMSTAWLQQADGRLAYRPSALFALDLASSYLRMDSSSAGGGGAFSMLRTGPDAELQWGRLEARLGVWGGLLDDSAAGVRDAQAGVSAGLLARLTGNLDGLATFDWAASVTSAGLTTDRYARRVFLAGVVGHITGKLTLASSAGADLLPLFQAGRVRLRTRVEHAGEVSVIGSWDGWARSTPSHTTGQPGLWEVWLDLRPGTHRYRFLVDGRAVAPYDGVRTLPDDFGGRDAVIDVSEGQGTP